jgi:hypothetical protein
MEFRVTICIFIKMNVFDWLRAQLLFARAQFRLSSGFWGRLPCHLVQCCRYLGRRGPQSRTGNGSTVSIHPYHVCWCNDSPQLALCLFALVQHYPMKNHAIAAESLIAFRPLAAANGPSGGHWRCRAYRSRIGISGPLWTFRSAAPSPRLVRSPCSACRRP